MSASKRASNRRRGQPRNPGQFAKEPSKQADVADVHEVDLGSTPMSAPVEADERHGPIIGVPAEDDSGRYLLRGSADGSPVLASIPGPGPGNDIACSLSYGVGAGNGWEDAAHTMRTELVSDGWRPACDSTVVNPKSWNAGWDQGFAARQWYETEKKVKERWEEEHLDLTPKQRSELEALQQADLDIYRAITAEARKARDGMSALLCHADEGTISALHLLHEGRQAVADSVKSAGSNLLPEVEELQSCDPTATYVQVLPGGVGADGSKATISVGIGHLEIDPDMPEWDPVADPAVGVSLNINDFFERDSYMSLRLQENGTWRIPEFGLILRSGEEDALGLLG